MYNLELISSCFQMKRTRLRKNEAGLKILVYKLKACVCTFANQQDQSTP